MSGQKYHVRNEDLLCVSIFILHLIAKYPNNKKSKIYKNDLAQEEYDSFNLKAVNFLKDHHYINIDDCNLISLTYRG